MVIRYIKGEYVGENRNVLQILDELSSNVNETDTAHIERILTQECPSKLSFEETSDMKASIIRKGNQATFKMHPEIVTKTMNKEDRHSHVLPVKLWVLHFSPWCRHTAHGMLIKPSKNPRVIFDLLQTLDWLKSWNKCNMDQHCRKQNRGQDFEDQKIHS
jgi:hypothetical protein